MPTAGSEGSEAAGGRRAQLEALSKEELVQRLLSAEQQQQQQQQQKHEGTTSSAVGGGRGAPSSAGQGPHKRRKTNTPAQAGGASKVYRQDQRRSNGNFDFSKHRQRHVALRIAYFGHRFHGFAAQDDSDNTVEGHLFKALQRTCLVSDDVRSANYSRCGRTDIGVSAFGQVRPAPAPCHPPYPTLHPPTNACPPVRGGGGGGGCAVLRAACFADHSPPTVRKSRWASNTRRRRRRRRRRRLAGGGAAPAIQAAGGELAPAA
jgi:hypothetical protein